jgi:hypothetical protein
MGRERGIRAVYTPLAAPPAMAHATRVRRPSLRIASRAALGCAALVGCAGAPPADPDGTSATAQTIEVAPRVDALACGADAQPDCADWFRFRVAAAGALRVRVTPAPPAAGASASAPPALELAIAEASGKEIGRAKTGAGAQAAEVPLSPSAPTDYVAVVTAPPGAEAVAYRLSFEAPAQDTAPPPAVRVSRWTILEVDADGAILIDGGRRDGLRAGQRGRLVDGRRTLGAVVVVDVFEEGARARTLGPLSGEITADTVAEIEGPAGRR